MKRCKYFLFALLCAQPAPLLKAHSFEPSAPPLEEIEQEDPYAPSAPSLEEGDFDSKEINEAISRSLADQQQLKREWKEKMNNFRNIALAVVVVLAICLGINDALAK